jgi:hypothetical protein
MFTLHVSYSQNENSGIIYGLEAGTFLSTAKQSPFWLRTNKFGEVPLESNIFAIRGDVQKEYSSNDFKNAKLNNLAFGFGVRGVANIGKVNQFTFSELYGKPTVPFLQGGTNNFIDSFASDLDAYFNIISGRALTDDGNFTTTGNISGEGGNRAGNHLGTIDLAIEFNGEKSDLLLYKQSIYEDGSLATLSNIQDGLVGLKLIRKHVESGIKQISVEYLNTTNQGGRLSSLSNNIPELRGRDNYFNNGTYEDSWTYKGFTLGVPFLMPINATPNLGLSADTLKTINSSYI